VVFNRVFWENENIDELRVFLDFEIRVVGPSLIDFSSHVWSSCLLKLIESDIHACIEN